MYIEEVLMCSARIRSLASINETRSVAKVLITEESSL